MIFFPDSENSQRHKRRGIISHKGVMGDKKKTISKKPITQGAKISLLSKTQILTHRIFQKNSQSHQTNSQTQSQNNYTHKNQHHRNQNRKQFHNQIEIRKRKGLGLDLGP
jgi:hypothetical protein